MKKMFPTTWSGPEGTLHPSIHQGNRAWHSELAFLFWQLPIGIVTKIANGCCPALVQFRAGVASGTGNKHQEEISSRVASAGLPLTCWGHGSIVESCRSSTLLLQVHGFSRHHVGGS